MAYDQEWPTDEEEAALAMRIFGSRVNAEQRRRLVLGVFGARGGKTYSLVSLRLLHGALVRDLSALAPGQNAYAPIIAPHLDLAYEGINYVSGAVQSLPELESMVVSITTEAVTLRRPDGHTVSVRGFAASRGGLTGRGKCLTDAGLDESALFRDAGFAINDKEIYKAVSIRVLPQGQTLMFSTPWAEVGELYDRYKEGTTPYCLVGKAPTTVMHGVQWLADIIEEERRKDPENARREFDAEFMANDSEGYFDGNAVKQATKVYVLPKARESRFKYAAAADFGFRSDSSALVIVEFDGQTYRQVEEVELKPEPDKPLLPSAVVKLFAERIKAYGLTHLIADGHYFEAIREHLLEHKLNLLEGPSGATGKLDSHARAKAVLHEGRCEISEDSSLPEQLRQVLKRPNPGGGMTIYVKRKPGKGHGDIASAWVLAVNHLALAQVEPSAPVEPPFGTIEWQAWKFGQEEKALLKQERKRWGKPKGYGS